MGFVEEFGADVALGVCEGVVADGAVDDEEGVSGVGWVRENSPNSEKCVDVEVWRDRVAE